MPGREQVQEAPLLTLFLSQSAHREKEISHAGLEYRLRVQRCRLRGGALHHCQVDFTVLAKSATCCDLILAVIGSRRLILVFKYLCPSV